MWLALSIFTQAFAGKGYSRLELRFRPDDSYCKPAIARQSKPCCLALKIKRRKKREQPLGSNGRNESDNNVYEYSAELLGTVNMQFDFIGQ